MARLSFRCNEELVRWVDAERGLIPREAWLRRAVEQALSEAKEPSAKQQADRGSVPSSEGVRSAAPAEQPEEVVPFAGWPPISDAEAKREQRAEARARSSSAAKRDVRPVPKKGEK